MSRDSLTPFSYVILVLVGEDGAGAHDLRLMAERGSRVYWSAAASQFYAEPKRLAALGYLDAREEPGRTHARTHYTLTERGREAVREWLATPAQFPRIQHEAAVRVLVADMVDPAVMKDSLAALRTELDDQIRQLDVADEVAGSFPHRARWLRLNHRLSRRIVEAHLEWLDEVEKELDGKKR